MWAGVRSRAPDEYRVALLSLESTIGDDILNPKGRQSESQVTRDFQPSCTWIYEATNGLK